jgi:hypothetical protein
MDSSLVKASDESKERFEFVTPRVTQAEFYTAVRALENGRVPEHAKSHRIGRGKKTFTYVKHTWLTEQLRNALGYNWDFTVVSVQEYSDGSVGAIVRLDVRVPLGNDKFMTTSITEVGVQEQPTDKMPVSYRVASAVSRGLARCAMRRFGLGQEFYEEGDEAGPTVEDLWRDIQREANGVGVSQERVLELMKAMGINRENLNSRVIDLVQAIYREGNE